MGSFFGHALPGSMFYVLGVWCAVHTFIRLIQCRQQGKQFYSTCSFYVKVSSRPCLKDISMEAIVKICLCALGIIVEFIGGERFNDIFYVCICVFTLFDVILIVTVCTHVTVCVLKCDYVFS